MESKKQDMVAKSPPSEEKCSATQVSNTSADDTMTLALTGLGTLQCICGLLMGVFGILAIIHGSAMAGVGAGLWAGAAALACGCVALTAGLKRFCYQDDRTTLALTIYLALCLVCLAVDTLALLLTSTGLLRDSHRPSITYLQLDETGTSQVELEDTNWIPVLANVGLLLSTSLHTLATIVAVYRVYKLVCPCTRPRGGTSKSALLFAQESPTASYCSSSGSKHKLVRHWLGQQSPSLTPHPPNILIYPPHLIMEGGSPVYGVIPPPTLYAPYMHPMRPPSSSHYHRRASPNYRGEEERRRRKNYENNKIKEKTKPKEKEREITEEELERTYTGLDREIAEEFISIAMQPRDSPIDLNRSSLSKEI